MAYYSSKNSLEDLEITKDELKDLKEAFKKEEFRNLLNDYVNEVTDPKNKALFEEELTQFEKERGVDITFVYPEEGYVIKSSIDGRKKAFINICCNNNVGKPSSTVSTENGSQGLNWSIPYVQGQPRDDLDKKNVRCTVYDVVFHPDTLHLAKKNVKIRLMVNDIALSAIEDSFNVKLDRKNLVFPKMQYKGCKIATVIRKARKDHIQDEDLEFLPKAPYQYPPPNNDTPECTKPRSNYNDDSNQYTTPKYVLKHRREVDMKEFTNAVDSKFHCAIPSELVVEIHLPLIKSSTNVSLDIIDKTLSLISESPAKYKLNINLPYPVDDENGNATFDKSTKKLVVILPVKRCNFKQHEYLREDSGIESDVNQNNCSSSEEDFRRNVELVSACDTDNFANEKKNADVSVLRTSEESYFLNSDIHYCLPPNKVFIAVRSLIFNMQVTNIDAQSVAYKFLDKNEGVHFKFSSLGSGFFPIYYALCLKIPDVELDSSSLNIDIRDNNLSGNVKLINSEKPITSYFIGICLESLQLKTVTGASCSNPEDEEVTNNNDSIVNQDLQNHKIKTEGIADENEINITWSRECCIPAEETQFEEENQKLSQIKSTSIDSFVRDKSLIINGTFKNRTLSESSEKPDALVAGRRSILKGSRSLSESHTDDYNTWSSLDSESHDDLLANKKTVRFNDVVSKKVFRANSSILGQKKKNEKKARNRKKAAHERMMYAGSEESETDHTDRDECDSVSELSDVSSDDSNSTSSSSTSTVVPSSKRHRRRGAKNQRKAASTAKHTHFAEYI